MKIKTMTFLFITFLFAVSSAQQMQMISAEDALFLNEAGCLVKFEDNSLLIEKFPSHAGNSEQDKIDLRSGDQVLFINGERVKTFKEFKNIYENLGVGKEIELGVKRNAERFFVKFAKIDQPAGKVMRMKMGDGGSFSGTGGEKVEMKDGKMIINGKAYDMDSLKKSGSLRMIEKPDTVKIKK